MTLDYFYRMACLCLAVFFLVNLVVGLAVVALAPSVMRVVARRRAATAARLTYALRLLPFGCAAFVVAVLCVPSYLRFEPAVGEEAIGAACLIAALLGLSILAASLGRGVRAGLQSARLVKGCSRSSEGLHGAVSRVLVIDEPAPLLALVGVIHPRIVVSRSVIDGLSISEFAAALRHERAHRQSLDNVKRLLLILTPGLLPGWNGLERIESGWRRFSEWAADDRACAGRPQRSLALAAALVRMARIGRVRQAAALATYLLADEQELPARVERLLRSAPAIEKWSSGMIAGSAAIAIAALGAITLLGMTPLEAVHRILENIVG